LPRHPTVKFFWHNVGEIFGVVQLRAAGSGYFKNLKELTIFMKEPAVMEV
jgi:hypothetical protein